MRKITTMNVFLVPPKRALPANTVDTLRGGRKGDPQNKDRAKTVGSEDLKYGCVGKDVFQKASLY